ncbi:hypothetical protein [Thiohalorhabdus methylotrophus]|uniref:Uncharacterized protein n=1 Tax=Thiohalorhabdus methylotrophus TaxID=3242694 RepID=A0ABV4TX05_9GAMM
MKERTDAGRGGIALGLDNLDLSLQFLMTRYARSPDPGTAQAVVDHLTMLLKHPLVAELPEYRAFYNQQLACWQDLAHPSGQVERRRWRRLVPSLSHN